MAFPAHRLEEASALRIDDILLIYATRGCFHNPTRDRGRVIGEAWGASQVELLAEPVRFGDRKYPVGSALAVERLVPLGGGVELAPLVDQLAAFPEPARWGMQMRRTLVPLGGRDVTLLRAHLAQLHDLDVDQAVTSSFAAVPER